MLSRKDFCRKVAENIKRTREKRGISQEQLAHEAGLYRTYIGHIENARYLPSSYILYKIARALKISTSDLLP